MLSSSAFAWERILPDVSIFFAGNFITNNEKNVEKFIQIIKRPNKYKNKIPKCNLEHKE